MKTFLKNIKKSLFDYNILSVLKDCQLILDNAQSISWKDTKISLRNFETIISKCDKNNNERSLISKAYVSSLMANLLHDYCYNEKSKVYGESYNRKSVLLCMSSINKILIDQLENSNNFIYENGYPYQSLETMGIYGARDSFSRVIEYELCKHINKNDKVLDIGANSGFICILLSQLIQCHTTNYDHNKFFLEIGKNVSDHLQIEGITEFICQDVNTISDKIDNKKYNHVFSFASHFTDDEGIRNTYKEHFNMMKKFLLPKGKIYFESHCSDAQSSELDNFISTIENSFNLKVLCDKKIDNKSRRYLIFGEI